MEITEKNTNFKELDVEKLCESVIFWKTHHLKISQLIYISNHLTNISLKKKNFSFKDFVSKCEQTAVSC